MGDFEDLSPQQQLFLAIAISDRMAEMVSQFADCLQQGATLSAHNAQGHTPLTAAILDGMGSPLAVETLLALGADPQQVDANGWCPWAACQERLSDAVVAEEMQAIAEALLQWGINPELQPPAPRFSAVEDTLEPPTDAHPHHTAYSERYAELFAKQTNGINCDIDTEDIVKKLMDWDQRYGIRFENVTHDGLLVHFNRLPGNADALTALSEEIYNFCPDVIDQGFGCMDDMLDMFDAQGLALDDATRALIAGVDFEDENFGLILLARSLTADQQLQLWWD